MIRILSLLFVFAFTLGCFEVLADTAPAASPAAVAVAAPQAAPAPVVVAPSLGSPVSAGFIGLILAILACANIVLSAVQQVFAKLSKTEPGWLQSVSSIVLAIAKYLGSNPDAPKPPSA
jgi:hypothetical protein